MSESQQGLMERVEVAYSSATSGHRSEPKECSASPTITFSIRRQHWLLGPRTIRGYLRFLGYWRISRFHCRWSVLVLF